MPARAPYPVFLDLHLRHVLIVGGGAVSLRKANSLLTTGARITIVSPQFLPAFFDLKHMDLIHAPYAASHMASKPWRLVFAATNLPEVNAQVQTHAQAAGILCCRCDKPEAGDFSSGATRHIPAEISGDKPVESTVVLAVSTSFASPALAARICEQAADAVDPVLLKLAALASQWRVQAKAQLPVGPARRALLQKIASEEMESALRKKGESAATEKFHHWLAEAKQPQRPHPTEIPKPLPQASSKSRRAKHANQ